MATKANRLTVRGIAHWPKLKTPDSYNGNVIGWTIQVEPNAEEFKRVKKELALALEAAKSDKEFDGKAWLPEPNMGILEDKNGNLLFKFKKVHEFIDKKTKEVIQTTVPIYDKYGQPADYDIGNGSEVVVAFTPRAYHMNKNNNGLSLRLDAVQVLELKTRAMGADFFGFATEDAPEETVSDNPFS